MDVFEGYANIRLTTPQVMLFMTLYKKYSVLWDTRLPENRDRDLRLEALNKIARHLRIPNFGVKEVTQKIKNLRSTYFQEKKKVDSSILDGDPRPYRPRLKWYKIMHSCLSQINTPLEVGIQPPVNNVTVKTEEHDCEVEQETWMNEEFGEDNVLVNAEDNSSNGMDLGLSYDLKTPPHQTYNYPMGVQDNESKDKGEFEAFGDYVASALKSLPYANAIEAQSRIMLALTEEKRHAISKGDVPEK